MPSGLSSKIEMAANVVIVVSGLVITTYFVKPSLFTHAAPAPEMVKAGMQVGFASASGSGNESTLVVAVREGCPYCEASAPFYKQLLDAAAKNSKTHVIAALPESPAQAKPFLEKLGVPAQDVREADFDAMKVRYTPTLLLLDREGKVKNVWVGRLHDDEQKQVLKAAGLD
jgi:thiol-disulfide isomerase/thioredoxin